MSRQRFDALALLMALILALSAAAPTNTAWAAGQQPVCPGPVAEGFTRCHAWILRPRASSSPTGLSPATIKSVYQFSTSSTAGTGKTIAIVDAYDDPSAESDLAVFSSQYGLPACTTANGCFKKVNQSGGTSYPRTDGGWALEISLDVQWAHAIAPGAKILLVEATSNSFSNLLAAEEAIMVFPEGVRGLNKPFRERYRLRDFGFGFLRLALEAQAPVVPVGIVGAEEQAPALADLKPLARLLAMPALPITQIGQ